jgi:predicted lipid-binding transport protein (Tim44 family)
LSDAARTADDFDPSLAFECASRSTYIDAETPEDSSDMLDPLNLLLLVAAALVLWKLRSVLGERTGLERRPYEAPEQAPPANLPGPVVDQPTEPQAVNAVWKGFAEADSELAKNLQAIADRSTGFTARTFVDGAKMAYEMIHEAFAKGDKQALQPLLTRDVHDSFASAIDDRNMAKHTMKMQFVGVKSSKIEKAEMQGNIAQVTIRFIGEMIIATLDKTEKVIDGDASQVREVRDLWTFERDITSKNPNWKLADTGDDDTVG